MQIDLNWFAVFVAAVAAFVFGWLWYSPLLFGKVWMKEVWNNKQMSVTAIDITRTLIIALTLQVLAAFVMAHLLGIQWENMSSSANSYRLAVETSLWMWAAFMLPLNLSGYLWEGRKLKLALIGAGQSLSALILTAVILTALS